MENRRGEVKPLHGASIRPVKDGGVVGGGGEATPTILLSDTAVRRTSASDRD